jgi:SSS family solute:Na+ symporter
MTVPLLVILAFITVSGAVGILGRGRGEMSLERWTVGGRRFGVVLVWLLMASGSATFAFLGRAARRIARAGIHPRVSTIGCIISFTLLRRGACQAPRPARRLLPRAYSGRRSPGW